MNALRLAVPLLLALLFAPGWAVPSAASLKPDDPVINDHLGDAYWRIGRKLEAKYQWQQSLTLKPDKDLIATIDKKLKDGLADTPATKAANSNVQKIAD